MILTDDKVRLFSLISSCVTFFLGMLCLFSPYWRYKASYDTNDKTKFTGSNYEGMFSACIYSKEEKGATWACAIFVDGVQKEVAKNPDGSQVIDSNGDIVYLYVSVASGKGVSVKIKAFYDKSSFKKCIFILFSFFPVKTELLLKVLFAAVSTLNRDAFPGMHIQSPTPDALPSNHFKS